VKADGAETLVQPANDVEDECVLRDRLAKVPEVLSHALEAAAVVDDGQVALGEGAELLISVEGTRGAVAKELGLNCKPDRTSRGATLGDGVGEVVGDGAEQPGADDAVHPHPGRRGRRNVVGEDMAFQGVLAKDVEEGLLPVAVEGGVDVEDERNQRADIMDRHGLRMEIEEDRGLLLKQRLVEVEVAGVGFIILAILVARRLGRGPLLGGLETRESGVDLLLSGGGFAIRFLGTEQRGLAEFGDARALGVVLGARRGGPVRERGLAGYVDDAGVRHGAGALRAAPAQGKSARWDY